MRTMNARLTIGLGFAALLATMATPASAQYDREGRYVPSPMGVPTDPYARPIPNYSGTPGEAKGTPIWPRGMIPAPAPVERPKTPEVTPVYPSNRLVRATAETCAKGWSKATGLTPVEFRRACARFNRRHDE